MRTGGSSLAPRAPPGTARCTSSARRAGSSSASRVIVASVCSGSKRGTTATAAPARNVDDEPGRQAEHVRERRRAEHDVVRAERQRLRRVARGGADAAVGQDRALRPSRRAGREEDDGRRRRRSRSTIVARRVAVRGERLVDEGEPASRRATRSSTSGGARRTFSGTTIAPSRSAPKNAATNAGEFGSLIATRSPAPTPARRAARRPPRPPRAVELRVRDRAGPRTTAPAGRRARPHRLSGCGRGSSAREESQVT